MDNDELNQAFIEPPHVNYTIGGSEQDYSSDDEKKKEELKSELIKRSHARRRGAMRDPVWRQRVIDDLLRSHDENKPSVECIVPGCKRRITYQLSDNGKPIGWTHVRGNA